MNICSRCDTEWTPGRKTCPLCGCNQFYYAPSPAQLLAEMQAIRLENQARLRAVRGNYKPSAHGLRVIQTHSYRRRRPQRPD